MRSQPPGARGCVASPCPSPFSTRRVVCETPADGSRSAQVSAGFSVSEPVAQSAFGYVLGTGGFATPARYAECRFADNGYYPALHGLLGTRHIPRSKPISPFQHGDRGFSGRDTLQSSPAFPQLRNLRIDGFYSR